MSINTSYTFCSKFFSQSLADLINSPCLELIDLISKLTPLHPKTISNLQNLAQKIHTVSPISEEVKKNIEHLINNLIFKQFPKPELDSVREVIANALDAQVRAKNEEQPIEIKLENDRLTIQDHGDGFSSSSLINFLVQGQTSNLSQYLIKEENRMRGVTGRFGQGGLSIFYYLLYTSLPNSKEVPEILYKENERILKIPYFCEGVLYEVTFTKLNGEGVKIDFHSHTIRKEISIKTRSKEEALKIKFFENKGKINLSVVSIDPTPLLIGTRFRVISPMVTKVKESLSHSIKENFEFVSSAPICFNNKKINHQKKTSSQDATEKTIDIFKTISIDVGSISYTPLSITSSRKGKLSVCEEGKMIVTFQLKDALVPKKVAVNFNYLPLTQDRASINFEDPKGSTFLTLLIEKIIKSSLSSKEMSALLNSLHPLISSDGFNLLPFVVDLMQKYYDKDLLPDLPEFENLVLEDYLMLNPEYLTFTTAGHFHMSGSFVFYKIDTPLPFPISYSKFSEKTHFFVDSRILNSKNLQHAYFNLSLINNWLKKKGFDIQIPIKKLLNMESKKSENLKTYVKNKLQSDAYANMNQSDDGLDAEEGIEGNLIEKYIEDLGGMNKNHVKDSIEATKIFFFQKATNIPKKYIKHFFTLMCFNEEARSFILSNGNFYIPSYFTIPLEPITPFLLQVILYFKEHPDQSHLYTIFLKNTHLVYYSKEQIIQTESEESFQEVYQKWYKVIKASGCRDTKLINKSVCSSMKVEKLDHLHLLMHKMSDFKSEILSFWTCLDDITYLASLPSYQIERIVKMISYREKRNKGIVKKNFFYNKIHYDKILSLLEILPKKLEKKAAWVFVYFELVYPKYCWKGLTVNLDSTQTELIALAKEAENPDIIADLIATILKINQFTLYDSKVNEVRNKGSLKEWFSKEYSSILCEQIKNENIFPEDVPFSIQDFVVKFLEYFYFQIKLQQNPSNETLLPAREKHLERLERFQCILPNARGWIYSAYLGGEIEFYSKDFTWPKLSSEKLPLEKDKDILEEFQNKDLAATRIHNALDQTTKEFAWVLEVIKNSLEAGATKIEVIGYLDTENHLTLEITDNGHGMGKNEIKALKLPGVTTKSKHQEDPNYGWGFYTTLKTCKKVFIATSQDGTSETHLLFKKSQDIQLQTEEKDGSGFRGTKLLLQLSSEAPMRTLLKIKVEMITTCKYLKGVDITFQGKPLSSFHDVRAIIRHEEPLIEYRDDKRNVVVEIGNMNSGLYRKNIRIGNLPKEYFNLLPKKLKKIIFKEGVSFSVLLPDVKQNMNRNHLIDSSSVLHTIQRAILVASFQYVMPRLAKKDLDFITEDYWVDFRSEKMQDEFSKKIVKSLKNNKWKKLIDENLEERNFLKEVKEFFLLKEKQNIQFYSFDGNANDLIKSMKMKSVAKDLSDINKKIESFFRNSRTLNEVLMNLPIEKHKSTLIEIRLCVKKYLQKNGVLTESGHYSEQLIDLQYEIYKKHVADSLQAVREELNLDSGFDYLFSKFESEVLDRIQTIRGQGLIPQEIENLPFLEEFVKTVAKEFLKKEIEVVFYSKLDGNRGCTFQQSKTIQINRYSSNYKKLFTQFKKNVACIKDLSHNMIKDIIEWLDLICHETTHQEESVNSITHDKTFREELCRKLEKLFILNENEKNVLQIYQESF